MLALPLYWCVSACVQMGERVRESMLESLPPRYTLSLSPTGKQKNTFYDIQRFLLKPVFAEIHLFIIPFLFFIEK